MNKLNVKHWPKSERPRERLLEQGAQALSDAELLAVLLRNGIKGKDVLQISREILAEYGGLRGILSLEAKRLGEIKGLGTAKVTTLLAASEIARRSLLEKIIGADFIRDPESVLTYLTASLRDKKKEVFKVLYLNKANRIIAEEDLFHGTVDEAAIHPREAVKSALDHHASAVILVHNHPSGRAEPSLEDREITRKLKSALESVSIKILDHIIVGGDHYFSFSEHGLLG